MVLGCGLIAIFLKGQMLVYSLVIQSQEFKFMQCTQLTALF